MADNQRYFTLLTDKGKYKIAKASADKGEVKFSHFAIGDGRGQEVDPIPTQTRLVREVWRTQLDSVIVDPKNPAAVIINAIVPHNVGGWWMREFGLFDVDGDMLAVVKPAPYYKATSSEGQLEDVFYEFQLVIGEQAQVVVVVDPSILWATRDYVETRRISASQFMNTPWLAVKSITLTTPPSSSNQGDTYVVPANAKGAWASKTGQLTEWNGKTWNFWQTQDGHGVGLPDGRVFTKVNGQYVEVLASRNYVSSYVSSYRVPTAQNLSRAFMPIISMDVSTPPKNPLIGDAYFIPIGATGAWSGRDRYIAEWNGADWVTFGPPNGHCVGLPDGRLFSKINGQYIEKIAADSQSGKWNYTETVWGGANNIGASLTPTPTSLVAGLSVRFKALYTNTGSVTLNVNSLGAKPIVYHETGERLIGNDFQIGDIIKLIYDGTSWRLQPSLSYMDKRYSRLAAPPTDTYYVLPTGNDNNSGFAATAKDGFKTIEGAIKSITERYMTSKTIKLIVSPGTYDGFTIPPSFIGGWRITGNPTAPQNIIIDSTKSSSKYVRGANISTDGVIIEGMTLGALNECVYYTGGGNLRIKDCNLILGGTNATGATSYNGNIALAGTIKMTGSGLAAIYARKGEIRLGVTELEDVQTTRIEYNCSVSMGNFLSTASGLIYLNPNLTTLTGTCNGRRFHAHTNGVIALNGTNGNFIPGTYDGVAFTGGIVT